MSSRVVSGVLAFVLLATAGWQRIENVTGLDRPFTLDVIVKGHIVDACIDGRRTTITPHSAEGDRLSFFAKGGEVTFEDIRIRPLLDD